jgi:hypothetical protein
MSNDTAKTITTNIVPVQGTFEPLPPYECIDLIGPGGTAFFAPTNPNLDGVSITNSTINSSTVGLTTPAAAQFTTASQQNQPVGNNDLTTKLYVDSLASGISWKQPVNAATTANITLSGAQTIDAVSVVAGDRVLVKDQTAQADNGIYVAAAGTWSRSPDADTYDEMISALVFVESGGQAGCGVLLPNSAWWNAWGHRDHLEQLFGRRCLLCGNGFDPLWWRYTSTSQTPRSRLALMARAARLEPLRSTPRAN